MAANTVDAAIARMSGAAMMFVETSLDTRDLKAVHTDAIWLED